MYLHIVLGLMLNEAVLIMSFHTRRGTSNLSMEAQIHCELMWTILWEALQNIINLNLLISNSQGYFMHHQCLNYFHQHNDVHFLPPLKLKQPLQ